MKRSRISILFFVIFLMIITPLTPMSSAVNARAESISGSIYWYNGPGSVTVNDESDNYMINVSGTYVRSEYNYHYDYSSDLMELNTLSKASFQDYNKGNSLAWMDVPTGSGWSNTTDYWSIILHDVSTYNHDISQNGTNPGNPGFNSDNFCLLQDSFPAGTFPFPNLYNYASNTFSHWCAPANLTVNSYTYPTIEIDIDSTSPGTTYNLFYDVIDCNTNNVIITKLVEFSGQSGTLYLDSYFANLTSSSGNYKLFAQLQNQQNALDTFTTSCTGTQGGNSGGNDPVPELNSIQVSGMDNVTGLQSGSVSVSNLTPNTQYDYWHGLYDFVPHLGGSHCSYEFGGSPLHSFNSSTTTGSSWMLSNLLPFSLDLGGNYSDAEPFELHAGSNYCYVFGFKESSSQSWQIDTYLPFSASVGFSGCSSNQFCWDHQEYAEGASFSSGGKWVSYSKESRGDAISNIGLTPGQWYWEIDVLRQSGSDNFAFIGVHTGESASLNLAFANGDKTSNLALDEYGWAFDSASFVYHDSTQIQLPCFYGGCWTALQSYTIGIALDSETGSMWYSVDGKWLDYNYGNSGLSPRDYSQQIFGFEGDPGGMTNLSHWEDVYGDSGLSNKTLYPAVSDTGNNHGMSFKLVSGSTTYQVPEGFNVIDDFVLDSDGDGVLNYLEVDGCTDPSAINYDTYATDDDGSCMYTDHDDEPVWDCDGDGEFDGSNQFQYSQSLSAELIPESGIIMTDGDLLGAFVGDELRGVARTTDVPNAFGGGEAFMLIIYSNNQEGELVEFRYFDEGLGNVYGIQETLIFEADDTNGSLMNLNELNLNGEVHEFTTCGDPGDDDDDEESHPEDILTLNDIANNIPDKFDGTYNIIKEPFYLIAGDSTFSREVVLGGDHYSYWNEDNNYLIAWDESNGPRFLVFDLNSNSQETEEIVESLDDSQPIQGIFSWLNGADDYSSLGGDSRTQYYQNSSFSIPYEDELLVSIVYGIDNDGETHPQDVLILSDNNNNIPDKFDETYQIIKTAFSLSGSGYSREIQVGGDYYSYWNEDNNYLIAWDSVNGYWMVYHLNNLGDSFYDTEEVINALDDSDYDNLDGKTLSWLQSDDYSSIYATGSENYPETSYKIPLEEDSIVYGDQSDSGLEGWCMDPANSDEESQYDSKEDCENAGFSWILYLEPELYWGNGDDNPHVLAIDVDFDGTAPFPGLHEVEINLQVYEANPNFDSDGDEMPDFWEVNYGLNPNSPLDANADDDGDGLTNAEEFYLGTNPMSPDTDGDGLTDPWDTENGNDLSTPQLLYQANIQNNMDLEEIYGFIEQISNLQQFPDGLRYYCVNVTISEQASGNLKADAQDCFELDVNDAFSQNGGGGSENSFTTSVIWNHNSLLLDINMIVDYEHNGKDIHSDFTIDSYDALTNFNYEYSSGLLSFDANNYVNVGVQIEPSLIGMDYDKNYCINFYLEENPGQPDENTLQVNTGCFYLTNYSSINTQLIDFSHDLTSGTTSITSNLDPEGVGFNDGTNAIDDNIETSWISENSCTESYEHIILGIDPDLISGIGLKWNEEYFPEVFEIYSGENQNWTLLIPEFSFDSNRFPNGVMYFAFDQIFADEIKITCLNSLGPVGLSEIAVYRNHLDSDGDGINDHIDDCPDIPGNSPNGCQDNGDDPLDAYIWQDLTNLATVYTSSDFENNSGFKSIDDDDGTYWESDGYCPQDIVFDFGENYNVGAISISFDDEILNGLYFNAQIKYWNTQNGWWDVQSVGISLDQDTYGLHIQPQMTQKVMIQCIDFGANLKINEIEIFEAKSTWYQFDFDSDGIPNGNDQCFNGYQFDSNGQNDYDGDGCEDINEDWDDDNDNIDDNLDNCPMGQFNWNSWDGNTDYDHDGCFDATEDNDDDADGVDDGFDNCSLTRLGATVDASGCETSFEDQDSDGVADSYDQCPGTEPGVQVDQFTGCPLGSNHHIEISTNFDQRIINFGGELVEIQSNEGWPSVDVVVFGLDIGTQYEINAKMWDYTTFPEEQMYCNNWPSQIISGPCEFSYSFTAQAEEMNMTLHYPALESSTQACLVVKLLEEGIEKQNNILCWNQNSISDWDFDGVIDINDYCGATPINSTVNETGCIIIDTGNETIGDTLLDSDGDGVSDLDSNGTVLDECPDTEEGVEVDEVGCATSILLPPALASALDFILNIDSLLGLPDGTLEILFAALGMMFGVLRFVGRRTLAGKSKRVEKYAKEIRLARSRRELENLERRITKDNEKRLFPQGGFGDLMELIETRALELGEMDLAKQVHNSADEYEMSQEQMLEQMEGTRQAVEGLQEELTEMRRKGPPGKGRGRKGPPRRGKGGGSGYQMQQSGGPRRPSLHPADLDGDGFVTDEEKRLYRQRQEQEDGLWDYD